MEVQKTGAWHGAIEFNRHLDVVDGQVVCGACRAKLGPSRVPSDAFEAYSAGIDMGLAMQGHKCQKERET